MATEFEQLAKQNGTRRGRPSVLTPEQKAERAAQHQAKARLRTEARRRAHIVLQYRYLDEFTALLNQELENLSNNDPRYKGIPFNRADVASIINSDAAEAVEVASGRPSPDWD